MKTFAKFLVLPLALMLLSLTARAAIRSVGNGGGLGEMQAISLHQRLVTLLKPCTQAAANPCALRSEDRHDLTEALRAAQASTPERLVLDPSLSSGVIFSTERRTGALIRVSPWALYENEGPTPKPASRIAAILLAAFLWQSGAGPNADTLIARAARITSIINEDRKEWSLSTEPLLRLHQRTLRNGSSRETGLWLEDREKTADLSDLVLSELRPLATPFEFENWRRIETNETKRIAVLGDLVVDHGAERSYLTVMVAFRLDDKGLFNEDSVEVRVRPSH